MEIDHCPVCGRPGSLIRASRIINGKRYGPYPQVRHYAGYDSEAHQPKVTVCYVRIQRLNPNQKVQLERLLRKHSDE